MMNGSFRLVVLLIPISCCAAIEYEILAYLSVNLASALMKANEQPRESVGRRRVRAHASGRPVRVRTGVQASVTRGAQRRVHAQVRVRTKRRGRGRDGRGHPHLMKLSFYSLLLSTALESTPVQHSSRFWKHTQDPSNHPVSWHVKGPFSLFFINFRPKSAFQTTNATSRALIMVKYRHGRVPINHFLWSVSAFISNQLV